MNAKNEVAERLEKLVQAGTDPQKDLDAAKADLLQAKIQGQKDEHEAETNVENAKRTLATLERQLLPGRHRSRAVGQGDGEHGDRGGRGSRGPRRPGAAGPGV